MLPISLRAIYGLNAATFQVSSLALLSIVNTRVGIPAEYLPAYGAISFLPFSLRPIFAWVSSSLLGLLNRTQQHASASATTTTTIDSNIKNRHDKLLFPAYLLACLAFVGTIFIPAGGFVLCFVFGFLRGIAGAWSDFLIGMSMIEISKLQTRFPPSLSGSDLNGATYEHLVSVNTAQSSTAKNIGSFVASIGAFLFFSQNGRDLEERTANTLLLGTAAIFLIASLVSLKYQFHVGKMLANFNCYDTINDNEEELYDGQDGLERAGLGTPNAHSSSAANHTEKKETKGTHWQQIIDVSTLVSFQMLLAVSALQKPIIAVSNQTVWVAMVVIVSIILIATICLGCQIEQQKTAAASPISNTQNCDINQQHQRIPHRQLNLYFLLRYSLPIAAFVMYSYLYTVFEREPAFLQLLSVLQAAIGSLSTFCYEKFLSPYCHSGWPLIGVIASLDIVTGLVALLDVYVVRMVKEKEIDGEYSIDTSLRCIVAVVGLVKYFFGELDYMPALVLSTANVYNDDDIVSHECENTTSNEFSSKVEESNIDEFVVEGTPWSPSVSPLRLDVCEEENNVHAKLHQKKPQTTPLISAGMQYASFLSCIDFGAQIGDWIAVPIIASLGITRENHWDHLDRFIILCSIFRMARVVFLWLICPSLTPTPIATR